MNPWAELITKLCLNMVPTCTQLYQVHARHQRELNREEMQERILKKRGHLVNGFVKSGHIKPTTSLTTGIHEGEDVETLGRRKWQEYHGFVESLPDDADPKMVKDAMKDLEKNIKKFPCQECQEHAKEHLEESPLIEATTKEEAVRKLCEFHNMVNRDLGKPVHTC